MQHRVTAEVPFLGECAPLEKIFKNFGDMGSEPIFSVDEAVDDIRSACSAGLIRDLDLGEFNNMFQAMVVHAQANAATFGSQSGAQLLRRDILVLLLFTCEFPNYARSFHKVLGERLCCADYNSIQPFARFVWLLLKALTKCLPSVEKTVYCGIRGVDLSPNYPVGSIIEWHKFSSCLCSTEAQNLFIGTSGVRTMLSVELTTDRGRDISNFSAIPEEREVLLPPNTRLRVVDCEEMREGFRVIKLVEEPPMVSFAPFIPNFHAERGDEVQSSSFPRSPVVLTPPAMPDSTLARAEEILRLQSRILCKSAVAFQRVKYLADSEVNHLAEAILARRYGDGTMFVDKNVSLSNEYANKALPWLRRQSAEGNRYAQYFLGTMYHYSVGVDKDAAEAFRLYSASADQGVSLALVCVGNCYDRGDGATKDVALATQCYQQAADRGDCVGSRIMGAHYMTGSRGGAADHSRAVVYLRQAVSQDDPYAMMDLAQCCDGGTGVSVDYAEAARLRKVAQDIVISSATPSEAQLRGEEVMQLQGGVLRGDVNSFRRVQFLAEQGNHFAEAIVARRYGAGDMFVRQDTAKSEYYSAKALAGLIPLSRDSGNKYAQYCLGFMLHYAVGVERDAAKALRYYQAAAEQGVALAMVCMGNCYEKGEGVGKDNVEAAKWFRRGADCGDGVGQRNFGMWCLTGVPGVPKDVPLGFHYIQLAAKQHDAYCMRKLAECYENGVGAPLNYQEAAQLKARAAEIEAACRPQ